MSVALDILNAVKAVVEAAYPGKTCHVRRDSSMNPALWEDVDTALGEFTVSCNDDVPTEMAWAGSKFCRYKVTLTYCTSEVPGDFEESQDVRDVTEQAARLFLKPGLTGVAVVNDVNVQPKPPYAMPGPNKTVNCTPLLLTVETIEPSE